MITIGVDAHKRVHQALAVDADGRQLGHWRGPNSAEGWHRLWQWAAELGDTRRWGIEGAWSYGRGLAQSLVGRGEVVYEINTRWTAVGRRSAHKPGKTDRLDASAIALFVTREAPALPQVFADDATTVLDLLATEREAAVVEATRLRNQLHALLMQFDPEYQDRLPKLKTKAGLRAVRRLRTSGADALQAARAASIRRLAARLELALEHAGELAAEIRERAAQSCQPLTALCGIDLLTAGTLAGILGPGHRFATEAQLAAYGGVAPLETSSAGYVRHRLNRWQPAPQRHAVHDRDHTGSPLGRGARLPRPPRVRGQVTARDDPRTETLHRARGLAALAAVLRVAGAATELGSRVMRSRCPRHRKRTPARRPSPASLTLPSTVRERR